MKQRKKKKNNIGLLREKNSFTAKIFVPLLRNTLLP